MDSRRLVRWLLWPLALYLAICVLMYSAQHWLQFRPNPAAMDASAVGVPGLVSQTLVTPDGERIVVWWLAPRDAAAPVYLYLHGNGANLMARVARLRRLAASGAGFMALSWRGYGGSSGQPDEAGLLSDVRTAWAALAQRVPPARVVLFGESLGTAVATILAAEVPAAAMVLDSSFASALDVAQHRYPWLPVALLMKSPLRADLAAPQVRMPVLQVHCRDDPVTPIESALKLNALLPQRRPLVILQDRCHTPSYARFEPQVQEFVASVLR